MLFIMELVQLQINKFVYYSLNKEYKQFLKTYNIITLLSLSINDIVQNKYKVYNIDNNYNFIERILPNSSWNLYNKKIEQYISVSDYYFLLDNYVCYISGKLYTFTNLKKPLYNKLKRILSINNSKVINKCLEYSINNKIDTSYFIQLYNVIIEKSEWFFINESSYINYDNISNLQIVQAALIDNIRYVKENCIDSWLNIKWWIFRGWSEDYAISQISKIQSQNSLKYREKYNNNPQKYASCLTTKLEYYTKKGFTKDDAIKLLAERQRTFTYDKCLKKYGELEGIRIFNKRQQKWLHTMYNKPNYIEIIHKRVKNGLGVSTISQNFFKQIHENLLNSNIIIDDICYHQNNHEWGFGIKNRGGVLYDFVIPSLKIAIEFNGERFHPNKDKLSSTEWEQWENPWHKSANYVYKRDIEKNNAIINKGFTLYIVWESEYKQNKEYYIRLYTEKIINAYEKSKIC